MPGKFDPNKITILYVKVWGGEPAGGSSLAPKVGPLGIVRFAFHLFQSAKKLGEDIAKATAAYKTMKCTVKLTIQNRKAEIDVVPTSSTLILKALGEPPRDRKKQKEPVHDGNITLEQFYDIARKIRHKSLSKTFAGTCMELAGTCFSIGCTVDGKHPRDIQQAIREKDLIPQE